MLKELVSLLGKEQAEVLLEWLDGKSFFKMIYDFMNTTIIFKYYDLFSSIEIKTQSTKELERILYDEFKFNKYFKHGRCVVNVKYIPFDAQPYLQILKDL